MERVTVPTAVVRAWARQNGYEVGIRGHIRQEILDAFNKKHRKKQAANTNPWHSSNRQEVPA